MDTKELREILEFEGFQFPGTATRDELEDYVDSLMVHLHSEALELNK